MNYPNYLAVTKLDALYPKVRGVTEYSELPEQGQTFIKKLEKELNVPIALIGTGPGLEDMVDLRKEKGLL